MVGIKDLLLSRPTAFMPRDDLVETTNCDMIGIPFNDHILISVFHGSRVVIFIKANKQHTVDASRLSPARLEGRKGLIPDVLAGSRVVRIVRSGKGEMTSRRNSDRMKRNGVGLP